MGEVGDPCATECPEGESLCSELDVPRSTALACAEFCRGDVSTTARVRTQVIPAKARAFIQEPALTVAFCFFRRSLGTIGRSGITLFFNVICSCEVLAVAVCCSGATFVSGLDGDSFFKPIKPLTRDWRRCDCVCGERSLGRLDWVFQVCTRDGLEFAQRHRG